MNSHPADKLARRQARHVRPSGKIKAAAYPAPGSRNRHKTAPKGNGKRSRSTVQGDSRDATN